MDTNHALFLDRDGTIINDCEGVLHEKNILFEEGLKDFLEIALKKNYFIIMVSNQTSVSKGLISYEKMNNINNILLLRINDLLGQNVFNEVFICPYHPDAQVLKYRINSEDRKPKPGMFFKAQKRLNINLKNSIMVGDRVSDIVAGNLAGCKTVLKINKFSNLKMITTNLKYSKEMEQPNYKISKLREMITIMENLI